jgi:all-trans-retinol 13,14-reductase
MTHYMTGGAYSVGATQNISTRLSSTCRSYGGEALIDATVRSIIVKNGRAVGVRVSNTDELEEALDQSNVAVYEIFAKNIVCATSVYNLYNKFLPQGESLFTGIPQYLFYSNADRVCGSVHALES